MNATNKIIKMKTEFSLKKNQQPILENEVFETLGNEFPSIKIELEKSHHNIYKIIHCFADYTKLLIRKENFKEVRRCFEVAEKLLQYGNSSVKNAIENGYVFSLSALIDLSNSKAKIVKSLLTNALKKEYQNHIYSRGI